MHTGFVVDEFSSDSVFLSALLREWEPVDDYELEHAESASAAIKQMVTKLRLCDAGVLSIFF